MNKLRFSFTKLFKNLIGQQSYHIFFVVSSFKRILEISSPNNELFSLISEQNF